MVVEFGKKGQAEDIFSDMIPAVILIIIVVILAGFMSMNNERRIEAGAEAFADADMKEDVLAFTSMPIDYSYNNRSNITAGVFFGLAAGGEIKDAHSYCGSKFKNAARKFFGRPVVVNVYENNKKVFSCATEDMEFIALPEMPEPQELAEDYARIIVPSGKGELAVVEVGYGK